MVWISGGSTCGKGINGEQRCGTLRTSMKSNILLNRAGVGEVKKTTFASADDDTVFGIPQRFDAEGSREVTMIWKEHKANPDDKPGPDFRAMNKSAARSGLTKAVEQHDFRRTNQISLKSGEAVKKPVPPLPSDKDQKHTYGVKGTHRTAEMMRAAGEFEPNIKCLVQAAYKYDWMKMNKDREHIFDKKASYVKPTPTKATLGHKSGAQKYLNQQTQKDEFKLKKFTKVPAKIQLTPATLHRSQCEEADKQRSIQQETLKKQATSNEEENYNQSEQQELPQHNSSENEHHYEQNFDQMETQNFNSKGYFGSTEE